MTGLRMANTGEHFSSGCEVVAPPATAQPQGWGNFSRFAAHDDTPSLNEWAGDVSAMVSDSLHTPIINRTKV